MNNYEARQEARREGLATAAAKRRQEAARLAEAGDAALKLIPFGQPILVGHHSEKSDRAYRGRALRKITKSIALDKEAAELEARAEAVGRGGISSDDPEAVVKLKTKLDELGRGQALMKAANAEARKTGADRLYPAYALANNNGNMARIRERIKTLTARETMTEVAPVIGNGWTLAEDAADNRIMFTFGNIPPEATRSILKGWGFKWSPTRGSWVRMLNSNGRYAAGQVKTKLEAVVVGS
mgnify:CR=1 FL=1